MVPPQKVVLHLHAVLIIMLVICSQMIKHPNLNHSLLVKSFLVPDYLQGYVLLHLVVERLYHLTKTALA